MDDFEEIKAIWQSEQPDSLPSLERITTVIQKHKRDQIFKRYMVIAGMVCCLLLMVLLAVFHPYNMWTTSVGIGFFILTVILFIAITFRTLRNKRTYELLDNEQYLRQLHKDETDHYKRFSWRLLSAFILWLLSVSFYVYEWISLNSTTLVAGYSCLLVVTLFIWFVYRPFMAKRYWEKNSLFRKKIEILKNQLP